MKIKVVQSRVFTLDVKRNFENMIQEIQSTESDVSLIVFPSNALFGKMHNDRILEKGIQKDLVFYQNQLLELDIPQAIVWGGISFEEENIYECIYFRQDEDLKKIYKRTLNDGKYSNESKYYAVGEISQGVVIMNKLKISISFFDDFTEGASDLNIVLDSSYWYQGVKDFRLKKLASTNSPTLYVNHVGMQNNGKNVFVYDGGSFVSMDSKIYPLFEDCKTSSVVLKPNESIPKVNNKADIYSALISLLRYYDEELFPFKPTWIVGVSGGLDSSVSIALLTRALGNERVLGVTMPSRYNKQTTQDNAVLLSKNLDVELLTIPIEELAKETVQSLENVNIDASSGLAYENIQARLRGHILMSISSVRNGVIMNNGNKLEVAFGYATMYGDSIGALSIFGDLNKLQVSALGELLNEDFGKEVVPKNLLAEVSEEKIVWDFAPSAELAQDQLDPMKWGYHDYLIEYLMNHSVVEILNLYDSNEIYDTKFGHYIKMYGLEDPKEFIKDLDWVVKQFYGSIYKRIQMPPIAVMSQSAFGTGYTESQNSFYKSSEYTKLREKILSSTI